MQSRTQSNACARARMALALGKLNFSCAVIGLTFINRACRQGTGTPKFRGSGCQFPQSQCHPSPHTGIALGTRLVAMLLVCPTSLFYSVQWQTISLGYPMHYALIMLTLLVVMHPTLFYCLMLDYFTLSRVECCHSMG
jgi:hypothetical protein